MHIFRSGKIQVFVQVGETFALVHPPPPPFGHHSLTVNQAVVWSIDYINPSNTAKPKLFLLALIPKCSGKWSLIDG